MNSFAERLKLLRNSKKITQKKLAEEMSIHTNTYQKYELSQRKPTLDNLIFISEYFDVSIDYLLGRTENPNSHKS